MCTFPHGSHCRWRQFEITFSIPTLRRVMWTRRQKPRADENWQSESSHSFECDVGDGDSLQSKVVHVQWPRENSQRSSGWIAEGLWSLGKTNMRDRWCGYWCWQDDWDEGLMIIADNERNSTSIKGRHISSLAKCPLYQVLGKIASQLAGCRAISIRGISMVSSADCDYLITVDRNYTRWII